MVPSLSVVSSWSIRSVLVLVAALAACTEPVERTQVTVVIDADESVRALIRYVDVEVRSGSPDADVWDLKRMQQLMPRNGSKSWPLRLSLGRPEGRGRIGYLVTATAKSADDGTLSIVRALSDYVQGKSVELRLKFDEACMKRTELCASTFSCRLGECIDPFVPASELPTATGSGETRPAQTSETAMAGASGEAQTATGPMQAAAGMNGAAAGCQGATCPSAICAARDAKGTCLPCAPGFIGEDAKSCLPTLISLESSAGMLTPALDPKTTSYGLGVGLLAERVTLTFEAPPATEVRVNGRSLAGKTTWTSPVLPLGDTEVVIMLTAGSSSRTYELTLHRSGEQQASIVSPYPSGGDEFGYGVAISGDLIVAGAPYEDGSESKPAGEPDEAAKDSGAAYLFERTASGWVQRAYLKEDMPRAGAHFGYQVTIDGNRFAVSAPLDGDGGSVYVYEYGASGVKQVAILHSDSSGDAAFGRSLALRGDRLVIGSPNDSVGVNGAGSVSVFDFDGTTWQRTTVLRSETPGLLDYLGSSVAFDGDIVVSGATYRTVSGQTFPSGVVYVFERTQDGWKQAQMLSPTNPQATTFFGEHVSLVGTTLAIGGFFGGLSAGSAYVFTRGTDGKWTQEQTLQPNNSRTGDYFGERVLLLGPDLLLVGASHESSAGAGIGADGSGSLDQSGAVYLFSRSSGSWRESTEIKLSEPMANQELGIGVNASNGSFVIGAPSDPNRNGSSSKPGGVYVFR
jgi:hypothetical protein